MSIFTFGTDHRHPRTGEPVGMRYVQIEETEPGEARKKMVAGFGLKWGFEYGDAEGLEVAKRWGLTEIPLPSPVSPKRDDSNDELPVIYVFSNRKDGGEGPYYAIAQDGTCLGSHYCSNEGWGRVDLGFALGSRPDRHETYAKHYPDGYRMEFVSSAEYEDHEGLKAALAENLGKAPPTGEEK
jgi:hypothetical protein